MKAFGLCGDKEKNNAGLDISEEGEEGSAPEVKKSAAQARAAHISSGRSARRGSRRSQPRSPGAATSRDCLTFCAVVPQVAQGHLGCLSNTILIVWQTLMCMPVAIWVWVPMEFLLEARLGPNRLTCRRSRNASCLLPPRGQVIGPTDRRVRLSVEIPGDTKC